MMPKRYALHAGMGRAWQHDIAMPNFRISFFDTIDEAKRYADDSLKHTYDWWEVMDNDDGMKRVCGWSTGRTTPHLKEIDDANPILRELGLVSQTASV